MNKEGCASKLQADTIKRNSAERRLCQISESTVLIQTPEQSDSRELKNQAG